ncbi:MAG: nucleotidyltransferase domain-containing protein [Defluviitaleaceae bacterium]|nr:nucleotidyltransferase domain-containing protein [Defluviitaleaceae bacterium]
MLAISEITKICAKKENIKEVILYGSRAKGTHMEKSDIDIALKGENIDIEQLREEIDLIDTLLKIDLVDINNTKNDLLKKEVDKYGIILYRKI